MEWLPQRLHRKKGEILESPPRNVHLVLADEGPAFSGKGGLRVDCGICSGLLIRGQPEGPLVMECGRCGAINRWPPAPPAA